MQFTHEQLTTIDLLCGNMMKANNSTPYDAKSYDANSKALKAFLVSLLGEKLYTHCDSGKYGFNWGAYGSYGKDAQARVLEALEEQAHQEELDAQREEFYAQETILEALDGNTKLVRCVRIPLTRAGMRLIRRELRKLGLSKKQASSQSNIRDYEIGMIIENSWNDKTTRFELVA